MIVTLSEAKAYLRVDYSDEDALITQFINSGESLVTDTLRKHITTATDTEKTATLFAVAYLFEHREDANMAELQRNLRYILMTEREAKF